MFFHQPKKINKGRRNQIITAEAFWLIRLRWLAVICIVLTSTCVKYLFHIFIMQLHIYIIAVILLLVNLFSLLALRQIERNNTFLFFRKEKGIIIFQIATDLIILTCLLHYSGGVENPIIIYFIFHMIIASILLPTIASYLLTTFALVLICVLALLEYYQILPHYSLTGFSEYNFYQNRKFLLGTGFIFITTSYLVVYMTLSISSRLRHQEEATRKAVLKLEEKETIKNEYVLRLTHDIKGHITAIRNCLEAASVTYTKEEKEKFIQLAYKRTRWLTSFARSLLKLTRIRLNKRLSMSEYSIEEAIRNVIQELDTVASNKGIKIERDFEPIHRMVIGNQLSIEEAIDNLITNAIKYSPPDSEIKVQVRNHSSSVLIAVKDKGIGIPKHEQKYVFNEFYRASNVNSMDNEGSGFGLALVNQIIELHHGKIKLESKEDVGTKISILIPYNPG